MEEGGGRCWVINGLIVATIGRHKISYKGPISQKLQNLPRPKISLCAQYALIVTRFLLILKAKDGFICSIRQTCRIFNAFPAANKRVDKPIKPTGRNVRCFSA